MISPNARTRAEHLGDEARQRLADLDELIAAIEQQWHLTLGEPFLNANEGIVARARTADGGEAVLKLMAPMPWEDDQIGVLERAAGRGYARAIAVDRDKNAILLEALGKPLGDMGWSTERVMTTLVATLRQAWTVALPTTCDIKTGVQKAQERHWLVDQLWGKLERPCPAEVVSLAKRYCDRRAAAFDGDHAVYAHGDPHAGNALQVPKPRPGADSGFAFVDPDGLFIEPAYDLGAIMSGGEDGLKAGAIRALARHGARRWPKRPAPMGRRSGNGRSSNASRSGSTPSITAGLGARTSSMQQRNSAEPTNPAKNFANTSTFKLETSS
jgi:streptomycin 6-kinase